MKSKYSKKYSKSSKKNYRKRVNKSRSVTLVNTSGLSPLPSRYISKHKYAETVTLNGLGGLQSYVWNLNSMWDPNRTGVGHQPYGYDQLSNLYNRYRVISCRYVVSGISDSAKIQVCALPSNEPSPISNCSEARENPRAQYIVQNPDGLLKVMKGYVSLPKLMGRTTTQYMGDDRYQADIVSSPQELALLQIYTQGLNDDPTFNPAPTINILLEYTVEWFDIKTLDQS